MEKTDDGGDDDVMGVSVVVVKNEPYQLSDDHSGRGRWEQGKPD